MFPSRDPRTRAIALCHAFGTLAVEQFEAFLRDPPPPWSTNPVTGAVLPADDVEYDHALMLDTTRMAVAVVEFLGQRLDQLLPVPGQLQTLARDPALLLAVRNRRPSPTTTQEDGPVWAARVANYWQGMLGIHYVHQAALALAAILDNTDEPPTGIIGMARFILEMLAVTATCDISDYFTLPNLGEFIAEYVGFPADEDEPAQAPGDESPSIIVDAAPADPPPTPISWREFL